MQSRTETKHTVHLELTEKEATWLRAYVQNYVGTLEEPTEEYDMRKALFDALTPNAPGEGRGTLRTLDPIVGSSSEGTE